MEYAIICVLHHKERNPMKKYIITAKMQNDIIDLAMNTRGVDLYSVKWNWSGISKSVDKAYCQSEMEILEAIANLDFDKVDDMIMGGDVPVGGMVVVCDGKAPRNGFVCANGNEWIVRKLKVRESNAIVYSIFNEKSKC